MKITYKNQEYQFSVVLHKHFVGKRQVIDTCVWMCVPEIPDIFEATAKQNPDDTYCQLTGKRVAFSRLLEQLRTSGYPKDLRQWVWQVGEIYAGVGNGF